MKALKYIGLGIAGLLVLMIVVGALVGPSNKSASGQSGSDSQKPQAQPAHTAQWTEVTRLAGNGEKKSALFNLTGAEARLRYEVPAGDFVMFAAYVVEQGQDIMVQGGIPEVMLTGGETGESYLHKRSGSYYLNVTGNCTWEVVVEEKR